VEILKIARDSGMQIILNGRIGSEEYRSVIGSVEALERFAEALCKSVLPEGRGSRSRSEDGDFPALSGDLGSRRNR
jgi:hypothetical protein